jgi:hypothetical protein
MFNEWLTIKSSATWATHNPAKIRRLTGQLHIITGEENESAFAIGAAPIVSIN